MLSKSPKSLQQAWYRWKSLRLPWRKKFLVGLDLHGNTFWEFCDTLSSDKFRMRRICHPKSVQYSELELSPAWIQWLRHTRQNPPSLTEQSQDIVRQTNLKILAAEADARWAAKPSFLNAPDQNDKLQQAKYPMAQGRHIQQTDYTKDLRSAVESRLQDLPRPAELVDKPREGAEAGDQEKNRHPNRRQETREPGMSKPAEDPWKQARGGPSEGWQPRPWDGNLAAPRR